MSCFQTLLETIKTPLEVVSYLVVILGFPIAACQYLSEKKKDRFQREQEAYNSLDDKYIEFERLCFENPELDIFDVPDGNAHNGGSVKEKKQELVAFTMLFSIFERAHISYRSQSDPLRKAQWSGWDEFIGEYSNRANFREAWDRSGKTFEIEFQKYMHEKIKKARSSQSH